MECKSPIKKAFLEKFSQIYCRVTLQYLLDWAKKVQQNKGEGLKDLSKILSQIEDEYTKESFLTVVEIYYNGKLTPIKGIPDLLIDKFNKLTMIQQTFEEQMAGVFCDGIHLSWESKLIAILDILESRFRINFKTDSAIHSLMVI